MERDIRGRVALVTGAASGQGRAVAVALARNAWTVAAADIDETGLAQTARLASKDGLGDVKAVHVDVSEQASVEQAIDLVSEELGPIWLLAAAAGVLERHFVLDEGQPEHVRRIIDVNLLGVINTNRAAARAMVGRRDGGRIINWSSIGAVRAVPGYAAYQASKAAIESFSKTLALELAPDGITVNVIRPGTIRTPMLASLDRDREEEVTRRIPLGRWGVPEEVAEIVLFLAHKRASWITGAVLTIDGGVLAGSGDASFEGGAAQVGSQASLRQRR